MNGANGTLDFDAVINMTGFKTQLDQIERSIKQSNSRSAGEFDKLSSSVTNLGKVAGSYLAFDQLASLPGKIIAVRGEFQQLSSAFNVMLGSKAKGDKLFQDAVDFAAKTPFTLQDVGKSAKQLLAYGTAAESVVSDLKTLGDVAAGVGAPIQDLVYLYGTLRTQGKAMTVDIRQFAGRGIPIYAELAKVLGVAENQVSKMVEAGKVGFPQVEQAFKNMTKEGGQFNNMMSEQAKSLTGLMSNLEDAISRMFNDIGKSQEGLISGSIKAVTELVNNYKEVEKVLAAIVIAYGSYRAALMLAAAAQTASKLAESVQLMLMFRKELGLATAAQQAFNLTALKNPYIIMAAALIAAISYIVVFGEKMSDAERIQSKYNEAVEKTNVTVAELNSKQEQLIKSIKDENKSKTERKRLLDQLIKTNPNLLKGIDLENIATDASTKKIAENNFEREKQLRLKDAQSGLKTASEYFKSTEFQTLNYDPTTGQTYKRASTNQERLESAKSVLLAKQKLDDVLGSKYVTPKNGGGSGKGGVGGGSTEYQLTVDDYKEIAENANKIEAATKRWELAQTNVNEKLKDSQDFYKNIKAKELLAIGEARDVYMGSFDMKKSLEETTEKIKKENHENELDRIAKEKKAAEEKFRGQLQLANQLAGIIGGSIGQTAGGFLNVLDVAKTGGNIGQAFSSYGLSLAGDVVNQIRQQKAEKEAYYASVLQLQRAYNLELNNQLLLENKSSLIGDIIGQYKGNFSLIEKAQQDYKTIYDKISQAIVPGTNKNFLVEFKKLYPDFFDENGAIDTKIADVVLANNRDGQIKSELQSLVELQKQINASKEAIDQLTTSIGGSLEGSLREVLVNAFRDGSDAASTFGEDVGKVLENISSQILFQAVFAESFKKLKEDLDKAFANGDKDLSQEFGALLTESPEKIAQFNAGLLQLKEQGAAAGFNIFGSSGTSGSTDQLSGSIKGVSEQTASVVAGQMNAMRVTQALINQNLMGVVENTRQTAENTLAIKNLMSNGSSLRGNGIL